MWDATYSVWTLIAHPTAEHNSINRFNPRTGLIEPFVRDPAIQVRSDAPLSRPGRFVNFFEHSGRTHSLSRRSRTVAVSCISQSISAYPSLRPAHAQRSPMAWCRLWLGPDYQNGCVRAQRSMGPAIGLTDSSCGGEKGPTCARSRTPSSACPSAGAVRARREARSARGRAVWCWARAAREWEENKQGICRRGGSNRVLGGAIAPSYPPRLAVAACPPRFSFLFLSLTACNTEICTCGILRAENACVQYD